MKISRWKMIWGLKEELFNVFMFYLVMAAGIIFLSIQHFSRNSIIFVSVAEGTMVFLYVTGLFGYIIDIILKNIGETGWILEKNIKYVSDIPGSCWRILGCEIKVFEEGKKTKKLKVYKKLAPWPEGVISQYKIYYLRICKVVVGWEVVKGEKEKINLSRKPRKSK